MTKWLLNKEDRLMTWMIDQVFDMPIKEMRWIAKEIEEIDTDDEKSSFVLGYSFFFEYFDMDDVPVDAQIYIGELIRSYIRTSLEKVRFLVATWDRDMEIKKRVQALDELTEQAQDLDMGY